MTDVSVPFVVFGDINTNSDIPMPFKYTLNTFNGSDK